MWLIAHTPIDIHTGHSFIHSFGSSGQQVEWSTTVRIQYCTIRSKRCETRASVAERRGAARSGAAHSRRQVEREVSARRVARLHTRPIMRKGEERSAIRMRLSSSVLCCAVLRSAALCPDSTRAPAPALLVLMLHEARRQQSPRQPQLYAPAYSLIHKQFKRAINIHTCTYLSSYS